MRAYLFAGLAGLVASLAIAGAASAADILPSRDDACVISISGSLAEGDYENFTSLARSLFPEDVDESTSANTVCLDSPGGNLAEGVKFARHFYREGVGTVIGEGAECYSACAIMFMMGTAQGPEVAFANRKLHVLGRLGFHRPYLSLPSGRQVDSGLMAVAADNAFQAALDLISVANSKAPWTSDPMMAPDLIQAMLSHIGDDMYEIDTIDKAGRFGIEIVGADMTRLLTEESAYYACNNALQWQHGLTEGSITYTAKEAEPIKGHRAVKSISAKAGMIAFQVEGRKNGYASHGCVVAQAGEWLSACGVDEYTGTLLGGGMCDASDYEGKLEGVRDLALHDPATRLASLSPKATALRDPAHYEIRCFVRNGDLVEDDEPCLLVPGETPEGWYMATFVWPSGARTVLVNKGEDLEINGVPTRRVERDVFGFCYMNGRTGKEFCAGKPE